VTSCPATIVVVDQSPAVVELIEQALRAVGHYVLVTNDPLEVLEVASRVKIDVLVGEAASVDDVLSEKLQAAQPSLRVIRIAGWSSELEPPHEELEKQDEATVLRAPFSLDELHEAVRSLLEGRLGMI